VANEVDNFSASNEGWVNGTATGGVLQIAGTSTPGGKIVMRNTTQWAGNYNALSSAITLQMDIANPGATTLNVRIAMGSNTGGALGTAGTWYVTSDANDVVKGAGTGFTTHSFVLNDMVFAADSDAGLTLPQVLGAVAEMRILSSTTANFGPSVGANAGTLQVDNIRISVPASQTISAFTATPPGLTFGGGTSTLSATASSGLTVTFSSLTTGVCTVAGSTVTIVTAGSCTVAANQAGNASFFPAPQVTLGITIAQATQTITGLADSSTLSVTGSGASGNPVVFGTTTPGVCSVAGNTVTYDMGVGTCTVTANQAGNTNYSAAPQVTLGLTVTPADQTISGFAAAPDPGSFGGTSTLTATASSGLTVSFGSTTPAVCTVAGATVTYVTVGTCMLTADQAGNANYNGAPQVMLSVTVNAVLPGAPALISADPGPGPMDVTVTFTPPASDGGSPITNYVVDCSGFMASGPASPIIVSGIPAGTDVICTVSAENAVGTGPSSGTLGSASPPLSVPSLSAWSKVGMALLLMLAMFHFTRKTARQD
jgi:hypothetical protein